MNDFFQFNDKTTICFTRIRSSERYTKPLQSIADSMFHVCKSFMYNNPQYNYNFFGLSFSSGWPTKIYQNIADSDYIIIPSEAEFMFHIPDRVMSIVKKRSDEVLNGVREVIDGKTIIMVEQNAKKGLAFADIGYVLVSGETAIAGNGNDLLENPDVGRLFLGG